MKQVRKIIEIDEERCDGCGRCVPDCAEGSLQVIDGKARLVADNLCDGLGACLGSCPTGALTIIEREADEFDEEAVEAFLAAQQQNTPRPDGQAPPPGSGCPSARSESFAAPSACQSMNMPKPMAASGSLLTHWPIQIRLIPPHAPFLKGADVLVAADCTAAAAPDFQERYLAGKVVMMGCPKFDDAESYVQRFTEIIDTCGLKSITVLLMEVPCCSAMAVILKRALERATATVAVEQITLSTRGEEIGRVRWR